MRSRANEAWALTCAIRTVKKLIASRSHNSRKCRTHVHCMCTKRQFLIFYFYDSMRHTQMASEIEISNAINFEKIQNFFNDSAYKEILENSENFNTKLCIERRLRMPFLDPQTGVAQINSALFMKKSHRMPGYREGQIYTYPSARWRKPKRQYLLNHHHSYRAYQYQPGHHHHHSHAPAARDFHQSDNAVIASTDGNSMSASGDNDSKDSHPNAEREWFHDESELSHYHHHVDDYEDDFDSDNDFDESYSSRGKRKRGSRSRRNNTTLEGTPKRGRKGGGSRRRTTGGIDGEGTDRRRRGGNTSRMPEAIATSNMSANHSNSASPIATNDDTSQSSLVLPTTITSNASVGGCPTSNPPLDKTSNDASTSDATSFSAAASAVTTISSSSSNSTITANSLAGNVAAFAASTTTVSPKKDGKSMKPPRPEREIAQPSPYCDFCLGDHRENKKTNLPEELVSCSDCGRSGHPSCLQFTPNMIISVKRYRWQCIECKYCSICGTSDNDDQLLFCDDCDRGYHMYCLSPPLITPPEGSWSCKLCMEEFHKGEGN